MTHFKYIVAYVKDDSYVIKGKFNELTDAVELWRRIINALEKRPAINAAYIRADAAEDRLSDENYSEYLATLELQIWTRDDDDDDDEWKLEEWADKQLYCIYDMSFDMFKYFRKGIRFRTASEEESRLMSWSVAELAYSFEDVLKILNAE